MKNLFVLGVLVCAGCASTHLPAGVMEIARSTAPAGRFHIEFDADGRVLEAAGQVGLDSVPSACRTAVDAAFPGGRQTGAERVHTAGAGVWMVAKEIDGRPYEILVRDDGTVFGGEESLAATAWPAAVVDAAKAAVPGATLDRVERVWGTEARGAEAYHVKLVDRGESVRVGVSAEAKVVRVVRRIEGQVRIPR